MADGLDFDERGLNAKNNLLNMPDDDSSPYPNPL